MISRGRRLNRDTMRAILSKGPRLPTVTAIIPALNEERSIGAVLRAIPRDVVTEVIVVDGGSADGTADLAAANGATVVREHRRGYGRACAAGAAAAHGDVLVFLDADGASDPREIAGLLAPIARGEADLVLGSRLAGTMAAGAMPWHQHVGNHLSAGLLRRFYGLPVTDLGPYRAVRRGLLADLAIHDLTYGWPTEMVVKAARAGWRITEVPVSCHPRTGGQSKISGTVRGTILATFHILRTIARYATA
jgi:glycosyltransferase involved in cell wall biosynthesis